MLWKISWPTHKHLVPSGIRQQLHQVEEKPRFGHGRTEAMRGWRWLRDALSFAASAEGHQDFSAETAREEQWT